MLIAVVGVAAWMNIPMEMAPDLRLPSITVSYNWGTTSPEVMEQEVTRRVEQAATRLRNVEQIRSVTREGRSQVTVTFEKHTPVEYRILELQEYLYGLRQDLPPQVRQPVINRSIPQELQEQETFMAYSISGDRSNRELYRFARQHIRLPLLGYEGLADIEIQGAEDPALMIRFDTGLIEHYGIDPAQVLNDVRERLSWRSTGFVEERGSRFSLLDGSVDITFSSNSGLIEISSRHEVLSHSQMTENRPLSPLNVSFTDFSRSLIWRNAASLSARTSSLVCVRIMRLPSGTARRSRADGGDRARRAARRARPARSRAAGSCGSPA
jgi:multidrug efflux pump subunit AcrB